VLIAREEHPVDGPPRLLQARPRLGAGHDHDVPGGHADHQLAGDRPLQTVPEVVGEQHAGLQPVEREHQCRRLAVDAHPVEHRPQREGGVAADRPDRQPVSIEICPGDQPFAERRPDRVRDRQVAEKLVDHMLLEIAIVVRRHQDGQKRGARHRHACQPSRWHG
jgi:hypothetical protein